MPSPLPAAQLGDTDVDLLYKIAWTLWDSLGGSANGLPSPSASERNANTLLLRITQYLERL
jgi:hypothetical protein